MAIQVRIAPAKFFDPSSESEGPKRIVFIEATVPTSTRAPRGNTALGVAIPQWKPSPGASSERANGDPIITASAPQANALQISPEFTIPPSAITGT